MGQLTRVCKVEIVRHRRRRRGFASAGQYLHARIIYRKVQTTFTTLGLSIWHNGPFTQKAEKIGGGVLSCSK